MTFFPDLGTEASVASGPHVRAIGWLAAGHPFPIGQAPSELIDRVRLFVERSGESVGALALRVSQGFHTCELCGRFTSHSDFGVPSRSVLYVCPAMLEHYVTVHAYLPPSSFVEALMASPLPGTREYLKLAAPFREVHERDLMELALRARAHKARAPADE